MLSCRALKKRPERPAIALVISIIITSISMAMPVSMGLSTIIIVNTPTILTALLIKLGKPWLIISRITSVSFVYVLIISPCVRLSK